MDLLLSIKQGDSLVFEQVFAAYHEKLYFFLFKKTRSRYIAEEIVQETFTRLWKYRSSLDEQLSLSSQIFRIARTALIDLYRREAKHEKIQFRNRDSNSESIEPVSTKELTELIGSAIQKLPPIRRKVFIMSRVDGFSYREIAAQLSISQKTVENHISHALRQLREFMIDYLAILVFFIVSLRG
ncbi:MAG: RNA polymerase sigma-70 factor [Sediminibacterium sp.]|nr:RNA polymerase sigma-70 factor [Sediminibacterium sp.]MDP1810729.1 RNA polymerase sigma-70 factor [Sediminibacterium sp.]MDP3668037.1 RNA polymerase sigma-70 factor [Sediminibacterium sp.]